VSKVNKPLARKVAELGLILLACGIGFMVVELAFRGYIMYKFAVQASYSIIAMDTQVPVSGFTKPGRIFGPQPADTTYTMTHYNSNNEVVHFNKIHANNLGWTSRYDYTRQKAPGEYRIAVLGGSTTAAVTNENAWVDALQDNLNADRTLLAALGVEKVTVLNLAFVGAGMGLMAQSEAVIAKRFSADFVVVNFSIENVRQPSAGDFDIIPDEDFAVSVEDRSAPAKYPTVDYEAGPFKLTLLCPSGPQSPSNPDCYVSPIWVVPKGYRATSEEVAEAKRSVAWWRLSRTVLFSPKSLVISQLLGNPVTSQARAAPAPQESDDEHIAIALRAFRAIHRLHPRLLLAHNPHVWHNQSPTRLAIDHLISAIEAERFDVVRMSDHMPVALGADDQEWAKWYMFNGHWNDNGAEVYSEAMHQVIRDRLLELPRSSQASD
jgi:hypothetical protein